MNRRTLGIAGGACALMFIAWFVLLWSPKTAALSDARDAQEIADSKSSELEAQVARLEESLRNAPKLQADLDLVRSAIPAAPDLPQFILDADLAASRAGVAFLSIAPDKPAVAPGGPTQVDLQLTVKGEYQPLLTFLDELLSMRRLVMLDELAVTPDEETGELSASLQARMFTSELPAPTAAAAAAAAARTTTTTTEAKS